MNFNEYQKLAARTMPTGAGYLHALHGMASEVGEIHALYQKVFQGREIDYEHVLKEVGDLLWFVAEFCTIHGVNMGDVAEMNIDKLKKRFPEGFNVDRDMNREQGDV